MYVLYPCGAVCAESINVSKQVVDVAEPVVSPMDFEQPAGQDRGSGEDFASVSGYLQEFVTFGGHFGWHFNTIFLYRSTSTMPNRHLYILDAWRLIFHCRDPLFAAHDMFMYMI